jgi:hypothetical protein
VSDGVELNDGYSGSINKPVGVVGMWRAKAGASAGRPWLIRQIDYVAAMSVTKGSQGEALRLFFDESGFTGPRLLDRDQSVFSYASVAVTDDEAWRIINDARTAHPVQMPELKASKLLASANGISLVAHVLDAIEGRYSFIVQDKRLVLCGKLFEYIFEPVFQNDPNLLYAKNLHRFVAMYCYIFFLGPDGEEAIRQFERYMRSLDPGDAPLLFDPKQLSRFADDDPFKMVVKFAQGYRAIIVDDNRRMKAHAADQGKWALDVTISGLWSLLNHWGATGRPLWVTCDDSKPLKALIGPLTGGDDDPGIRRARELGGQTDQMGWTLAAPISFADSRGSPGLQVADLVAGAATQAAAREGDALAQVRDRLDRHIHPHSIAPDFEVVRLGTREADVNWLVLMELGERASRGVNPMHGLAEFYQFAEESWRPDILGRD